MPDYRARSRRRPLSVDSYFYGGDNLSDVVQSRLQAANNVLSGTSSAADIRRLQTSLNALPSSLPKLVVDGIFGAKTKARIQEFQSQHGLPVNGNPADPMMLVLLAGAAGPPLAPGSSSPGIAPAPPVSSGYYVKGTPFLWLVQGVDVGFGSHLLSFDPFADAQSALSAKLAASGYNARVVALRNESLEVSGSQNIDRASALDVKNQITGFAQAAGFIWNTSLPVQFNLQRSGSPIQIGSPGASATYGDKTPVQVKDALTELGVNPFSNDPGAVRNIPSASTVLGGLGGGTGTILIVVAAGLLAAKLLRG